MNGKLAITIITLLTIGLIISIYIGDMISCLINDSPIPIVEVVIVLFLIIGTFIGAIILKKYS